MLAERVSKAAWVGVLLAFAGGVGLTFGHAAGQGQSANAGQGQGGRPTKLQPAAVKSSKLKVQMNWVGRASSAGNLASPVVAGGTLLLINQAGSLDAWDGTSSYPLLDVGDVPAGVTPVGPEGLLNVASNSSGSRLYMMFTSLTVPSGIPQRLSPRAGADAWHVLCRFDFDGTTLSNATPITALQVRSDGHTGGGLTMIDDSTLLFVTGDNGDSGEDGRAFTQDPTNHLGKIVRIDASTGATEIAALGMRNVQRLIVDANGGDAHVIAADIGGWVAEEIDAIPVDELLPGGGRPNYGWGRHAADGKAREGTFYIDANGVAVGVAPLEAGFLQPIAQFGREGAELIGATGPVASPQSFNKIRYLFGDLVSGSVYALTGSPTTASQVVYRVSLVDSASRAVTLKTLVGGTRPDPRFFNFPDGTAGVLLETTGDFYRLIEVR